MMQPFKQGAPGAPSAGANPMAIADQMNIGIAAPHIFPGGRVDAPYAAAFARPQRRAPAARGRSTWLSRER